MASIRGKAGGCHAIGDVRGPCATIGSRVKLELVRGDATVDEYLAHARLLLRVVLSKVQHSLKISLQQPRLERIHDVVLVAKKDGISSGGNQRLPDIICMTQSRKMWVTDSLARWQSGHIGVDERSQWHHSILFMRCSFKVSHKKSLTHCGTGRDHTRLHCLFGGFHFSSNICR
ncbi:hypothetical protein V6N13_092671 [Hibiscus sabdariffa]